jgi:NADH-quinone oxidoreductase subunit N
VSKFYLIYSSAEAGLVWLAVLAIVNSVVALYFYFKVIRAMFAYPGGGHSYKVRTGTKIAIAVCLVLTVLVGVWPAPFLEFASRAVQALF